MTCEVHQSTHTVGCNGSPSTVNETNCNKNTFKKIELHQLLSDVSNHDSLEEGCHLLYCAGESGSAMKAVFERLPARKCGRSRISAFFA